MACNAVSNRHYRYKNLVRGSNMIRMQKLLASSQLKIDNLLQKRNETQNKVAEAEIRIAAFISEHNLPIRLCDHFFPLIKNITPISQEIRMA